MTIIHTQACVLQGAPCVGTLSRPPIASNPRSLHFTPRARQQTEDRGASGIDVAGFRPTSPKAWEIMSTKLRGNGVKFLTPAQLVSVSRTAAVIDVRPANEYAAGRVAGAINVQFYRPITGWDPRRIARRATFAFFGILNGTEYNDAFLAEFEAAVPNRRAAVVIYCNVGGTLEATGPSEFGQQTRSLTAAYQLATAGYSNISVVTGGYSDWCKEGRDIEYEE
jgi:rhodanese-related sulfurtransferase